MTEESFFDFLVEMGGGVQSENNHNQKEIGQNGRKKTDKSRE